MTAKSSYGCAIGGGNKGHSEGLVIKDANVTAKSVRKVVLIGSGEGVKTTPSTGVEISCGTYEKQLPAAYLAMGATQEKVGDVWGVTPGWIFSWLMEYPHLESKAKIVTRIVNLRHAAREYLAYGSLLGDLKPLDALPTESFDFNDCASESVDAKPISSTRAELPSVIGTVWKSADGYGRAVVAANLSASERTVRFRVPDVVAASILIRTLPSAVKSKPARFGSMLAETMSSGRISRIDRQFGCTTTASSGTRRAT